MEKKYPQWTSYVSFIISAIGSAIGLGNIWRFPYIMGKNGGAVFLLVYLLIIAFICVIPLSVELALGKIYKSDLLSIYESINKKFKIFGIVCLATAIIIPAFYFVVGGWILNYIWVFASGNIPSDFSQYFSSMSLDPFISPILTLLFLFLSLIFPYIGVNKGIEKANNIMMPAFGIMLLILAGYALTLPGAKEGLAFMFKLDFSKFSGEMVLSALGQALFTLGIGCGAMVTYGSYLKDEINIKKSSYTLIFFDTIAALLAGIMIFPIIFTNGIEPTKGSTLAFISIPQIFSSLPFSKFCALIFFILLFFTAITSGISLLESAVICFCKYYKMTRKKAVMLLFIIISLLAVPTSLSFGLLSEFHVCGKTLFDFLDYITANMLMPLCSIIACVIGGWYVKKVPKEAFGNGLYAKIFTFLLRYILPILLLIVIFFGLK